MLRILSKFSLSISNLLIVELLLRMSPMDFPLSFDGILLCHIYIFLSTFCITVIILHFYRFSHNRNTRLSAEHWKIMNLKWILNWFSLEGVLVFEFQVSSNIFLFYLSDVCEESFLSWGFLIILLICSYHESTEYCATRDAMQGQISYTKHGNPFWIY